MLVVGIRPEQREMSASSTATWQRMNEAWFRSCQDSDPGPAQSAAAMCPQDHGVPRRGGNHCYC